MTTKSQHSTLLTYTDTGTATHAQILHEEGPDGRRKQTELKLNGVQADGTQWPSRGFATLEDAQQWMLKFDRLYNQEHRHRGIRFVTPAQRHAGKDTELLVKRDAVYRQAQEKQPGRWSGKTRNWTPEGPAALNPGRQLKDSQLAA